MAGRKTKIAIIGSTGYGELPFLKEPKALKVATPYGKVEFKNGKYAGCEVFYLPRHGFKYSVLPHLINYRANIKALVDLGTDFILATSAVGTISKRFKPGDMVLLSDFIDFSKNRECTFCGREGMLFTDSCEPYSERLRKKLLFAAKKAQIKLYPKAVYVCTQGPRFETKAEIRAFEVLGGEVVGMTGVPEVVLACEVGIPYASVGIVTNFAAGKSKRRLSSEEVGQVMRLKAEELSRLFAKVIELL
jgi:5'-methylthioadenosine phosphorylase